MKYVYSSTGKRFTAEDEDAPDMVEFCGYSYEWPPAKKQEQELIPGQPSNILGAPPLPPLTGDEEDPSTWVTGVSDTGASTAELSRFAEPANRLDPD